MTTEVEPLSMHLPTAIRQAVEDMRRLRDDPRYRIRTSVWHRPCRGVCEICVAGALMAGRLGVRPDVEMFLCDWNHKPKVRRILDAVDWVRVGSPISAMVTVGLSCAVQPEDAPRKNVSRLLSSSHPADFYAGCEHLLEVADWIEANTVPTP